MRVINAEQGELGNILWQATLLPRSRHRNGVANGRGKVGRAAEGAHHLSDGIGDKPLKPSALLQLFLCEHPPHDAFEILTLGAFPLFNVVTVALLAVKVS